MQNVKIHLISPSGREQFLPVGFSFWVLLLGFLVPLFRRDIPWALAMLALDWATLGLARIFLAFTYNRSHLKDRLRAGARPVDERSYDMLRLLKLVQ